jgi:bacterioferritin (cytochrome b1)
MKGEFLADIEKVRRRAHDETERGPQQAGYRGELQYMVELLNEALTAEHLCAEHCHELAELALRWNARSLAEDFEKHAAAERARVDSIAKRIKDLGGKPVTSGDACCHAHVKPDGADSLADLVAEELEAERLAAETCHEIAERLGEIDPEVKNALESLRECEEEHTKKLSELLSSLKATIQAGPPQPELEKA